MSKPNCPVYDYRPGQHGRLTTAGENKFTVRTEGMSRTRLTETPRIGDINPSLRRF
jgi:hypothetical protein